MIYDGSSKSSIWSYLSRNLITGQSYVYKVIAVTLNGLTEESSEFTLNSCNDPSSLNPPRLIESTNTSHSLEWDPPLLSGGCPIVEYALFRNDGVSSNLPVEIDSA